MPEHTHTGKEKQMYFLVFGGLLVFTVITVVSALYLKLPLITAVLLALVIASVKATLVGGFFMHLFSEKQIVYLFLGITFIFFLGLLTLPLAQHHGMLHGGQVLHSNKSGMDPSH